MSGTAWRGTVSALCAILVGIGLARFAYTPLIPALVEAEWFAPAQAAYLGAANLAGYLAGALLGRPMAAWISAPMLLRGMMLAATASFLACAYPLPFGWFFLWRFISGVAGAVLMVLAAPTVLAHVPLEKRGLAGGLIFTSSGSASPPPARSYPSFSVSDCARPGSALACWRSRSRSRRGAGGPGSARRPDARP
jgi:MFS family permease